MNTPTTSLTFCQKDTIKKGIAYLTSMGCQFAVIDPEGNTYGDLVVVKPKEGKRSYRRINQFSKLGYSEKVASLKPGQSELFEAPEGVTADAYRKVISACGSKHFGNGSCTTHVEGDIIEILRIL